MKEKKSNRSECGPFIACGAAAVSFDHEPGEPTSVDKACETVKGFLKPKKRATSTESADSQARSSASAR